MCWCCFVGGFVAAVVVAVVIVVEGVAVVAVAGDDCDCLESSFGGAVVVGVVGLIEVDGSFVAGDDCLIAVVVVVGDVDCLIAGQIVVGVNYCTN